MTKDEALDVLKGRGFIHLSDMENILRTETSIIAPEDVALLMRILYEAAETPTPPEIIDEIKENEHARGDCDQDCTLCEDE